MAFRMFGISIEELKILKQYGFIAREVECKEGEDPGPIGATVNACLHSWVPATLEIASFTPSRRLRNTYIVLYRATWVTDSDAEY